MIVEDIRRKMVKAGKTTSGSESLRGNCSVIGVGLISGKQKERTKQPKRKSWEFRTNRERE
jgi:hypothetical protein